MTKVAFIGAGSIEFTRNIATDLCSYPEFRRVRGGSGGRPPGQHRGGRPPGQHLELALHDISAERLSFAERLVRQIVAQTGADATVTASADRRVVLSGAQYVINEIQVGGYPATRLDFDIPARYGLRQTIGDTLGIGGIFRGLRTIPVAVGIARDMLDCCPDAYLLNYSNPMAMLPWAIYEGTDFSRVFGLCHSVRDTHAFLASLVGVDPDEISFVTAGFNHQAFVLRFEHAGTSLYPRLAEVIDADPELGRRVRVELFRRFGYFPTESSEHSAEYVPWFMRHNSQVRQFRIVVGEYLARSQENLREFEYLSRQLDAGQPLDLEPTRELASQFIYSAETGAEQEIYVNVRNGGLIENLPANACVEVPCDIGGAGPRPKPVGPLPAQLAALNRTFLNVVELTVLAALSGNREHVYQAALLDPNAAATLTTDQIVVLCDELFDAHHALLPKELLR